MALTNEDLLAISNIVQSQVQPLKKDMQELKDDTQELKQIVVNIEKRVSNIEKRVSNIEKRVSNIEDGVTEIKLTLDNEIRVNIQRVAEGHLDLSRNLHEVIKPNNEVEMLAIKVRMLETDMREIKQKIK